VRNSIRETLTAHTLFEAQKPLRNHGTVAMGQSNGLSLTGSGTVGVTNAADGLWTASDGTISSNGAGALTFTNAGVFRKTAGTGTLLLGGAVAYTNSGTLELQSGHLRVSGDGASATLANSGQLAVVAGHTMALDRVTLQAGTTFSGAGTMLLNGTTTVTATVTLSVPAIQSATLTGSGTVNVGAPFTWNGGEISLAGGLEVLSGQTLTFPDNGVTRVLTATSLRNHGTVAMGHGNAISLSGSSAGIVNETDGLWTLTAGASTISSGGAPTIPGGYTFANAGLLQGAGTAVTTLTIGEFVGFSNTGTVTGVTLVFLP
jgi:hypothetical protein